MDRLSKSLGCFHRCVHLPHVFLHFLEVLVDELVHNLGRQVNPDVKNTVLFSVFKSILQVSFDVRNYLVSSREVKSIPLTIGLLVLLSFLTDLAIGKQVVEKLDTQHFHVFQRFEGRDVDMVTLCDVQEDSIDKEQECLNI